MKTKVLLSLSLVMLISGCGESKDDQIQKLITSACKHFHAANSMANADEQEANLEFREIVRLDPKYYLPIFGSNERYQFYSQQSFCQGVN